MNQFKCFIVGLIVSLLLPLASASAASAPDYYVYFFSYDDGLGTPDQTHSWATFVSVRTQKNKPSKIMQHTISWLPVSGAITPLSLGPERGRNYTLEETFAWAKRVNAKLADWGPFSITPELFERAVAFKKRLDGGDFWYRIIDSQNRVFNVLAPQKVKTPRAVMCSHAIADIVLEGPADPRGFLLTGLAGGFKVTAQVVWHLSDWFSRLDSDPSVYLIANESIKAEIDAALNLSAYPNRQHFTLTPQANHYCRTLEECRDLAGCAGAMSLDF